MILSSFEISQKAKHICVNTNSFVQVTDKAVYNSTISVNFKFVTTFVSASSKKLFLTLLVVSL